MKQTYMRFPDELHKRLRHEAAEDDVSMNQCVINLLEEALATRRVSIPNPQHRTETPPA